MPLAENARSLTAIGSAPPKAGVVVASPFPTIPRATFADDSLEKCPKILRRHLHRFLRPELNPSQLGKLVELINEHGLASVSAVDARYAGTVGRGPWVARITIARLDKSGGIPG